MYNRVAILLSWRRGIRKGARRIREYGVEQVELYILPCKHLGVIFLNRNDFLETELRAAEVSGKR